MKDPYYPYLEKAIQLANVRSPRDCPAAEDWEALEESLGVILPSDLKHLVSVLGSGGFGEFSLWNPAASSEYCLFSRAQLLWHTNTCRDLARDANVVLFPERGGAVPVGDGRHVDLMLDFHSVGAKYSIVLLDEDKREAHTVDMSVSQLIYELFSEELAASWAPEIRELFWGASDVFFSPF